ncbi:hypothetical protein ACFWP5_23705 [Streptomyces sp. NPDC058469]|uniref:hypothetical protein n=1 Tax=Streptomyces sp. NPDC058469 TaxID=3346514 RepID=UPI003663A7D3
MLGVDGFALQEEKRYGTPLVDVESGRAVDVLPDRECDTFAAWLTAHHGAEIICRDRVTAYSKTIEAISKSLITVGYASPFSRRALDG